MNKLFIILLSLVALSLQSCYDYDDDLPQREFNENLVYNDTIQRNGGQR